MLCREHRGGKTVPKNRLCYTETSVSGSLGYLGTVDWSVGGDGDGYVTPVSECVKCREVAWELEKDTFLKGVTRDGHGACEHP